MVPGLYSLGLFCFVVALLLPAYGVAASFTAAVASALAVQGLWAAMPGLRKALA
jgi:hypothetical protein